MEPTRIYTLGDYYKTKFLREDCHWVKGGNGVAANDCARRLSHKVPKDCILVPIPSVHGYNEAFTKMLAYYADLPYAQCLYRDVNNISLYAKKKRGETVTEQDTGIYADTGHIPMGKILLVDNVIATGTTMSAAIRAIGKPCEAACIAVDYDNYNAHKDTL